MIQLTNVKSSGYATINPKISLGQTPSSALKAEKLKSTLRKQKFHEREMKRSKVRNESSESLSVIPFVWLKYHCFLIKCSGQISNELQFNCFTSTRA